ncbi:MAG: hypothetical protein LBP76_03945 [Treponema sp.]|nr:hypothetical protein [Treponema sp.]
MKPLALSLIVMLLVSCASNRQFYYHGEDPFSEQLDEYYNSQKKHKRNLIISAASFGGGFLMGTYFMTARSMDFGDPVFNQIGIYTAYIGSAAALGFGIYSFIKWSRNMDLYLETLKLQTQYYNIIRP